jgi:hypothetical protein
MIEFLQVFVPERPWRERRLSPCAPPFIRSDLMLGLTSPGLVNGPRIFYHRRTHLLRMNRKILLSSARELGPERAETEEPSVQSGTMLPIMCPEKCEPPSRELAGEYFMGLGLQVSFRSGIWQLRIFLRWPITNFFRAGRDSIFLGVVHIENDAPPFSVICSRQSCHSNHLIGMYGSRQVRVQLYTHVCELESGYDKTTNTKRDVSGRCTIACDSF